MAEAANARWSGHASSLFVARCGACRHCVETSRAQEAPDRRALARHLDNLPADEPR